MPSETEVLNKLADEAAAPPESKPVESEETKATQVAEPVKEETTLEEKPLAEVEEELEPNLEETPESSGDFAKYKHLYKDNPDLRNIIGRERAFSDLGDYSEVKGVIEKVPTVADAEDMSTKAENHRLMGEAFRESPEEFFGSLAESDPRAFETSLSRLPEILAEEHPNLYSAQAREYSNRVISNVLAIAQNSRDEELLKAAQVVAQFLGVQRFAASDAQPRNSEAEKYKRQLRERDEADANAAFENFYNQTDEAIIDTGVSEIESTIKRALPDATQGQLKRLVTEAWDKVRSTMGAQPQTSSELTNRLQRARTNGRMGINEHKEIVSFATRRMKLIIPRICKDIISEWSKDVLQRNQKEITTKKDIAQKTRDAGSGPQGTTSAAAAPASSNKRRTSEDIYKELENRTYVPPAARS